MQLCRHVIERIVEFQEQVTLLRDFSLGLAPLEMYQVTRNALCSETGLQALETKLAETQAWQGKAAVNICDLHFVMEFMRQMDPDIDSNLSIYAKEICVSNAGRICSIQFGRILSPNFMNADEAVSVAPLCELTGLEVLTFWFGKLKELSMLSRLTHLRDLRLEGCRIKDVSFVRDFPQLQKLSISFNEIPDYTPLRHLQNLQSIWLHDYGLADLAPLLELRSLKEATIYSKQREGGSVSPVIDQLKNAGVSVYDP